MKEEQLKQIIILLIEEIEKYEMIVDFYENGKIGKILKLISRKGKIKKDELNDIRRLCESGNNTISNDSNNSARTNESHKIFTYEELIK